MDPSPLGASEGNDTDVDASRTSAHRFWDVPELVDHVLNYLNEDRVDLLVLSQVSKQLRAQALRAWARYLDIPVTVASNRLRFFIDNPALLADVRFLSLRSDVSERCADYGRNSKATVLDWSQLNHLLKMSVQRSDPDRVLPLVDLTIRPTDPLILPKCLSQQVVALRVIDDGKVTYRAPFHQRWYLVSNIIQGAAQGPGLNTFHFRQHSSWPPEVLQMSLGMWQKLVQYAPNLRDLRICVHDVRISCAALETSTFDKLETLRLLGSGPARASALENVLNRAKDVRHLDISPSWDRPLRLQQTLPHLRWIDTGRAVGADELRSFLRRHPNVVGLINDCLQPPSDAAPSTSSPLVDDPPILPKLAFAHIHESVTLQHHLDEQRPLANIAFDCLSEDDETGRCIRLLASNPRAARNVTCLGVSVPWDKLPVTHFKMLGSRTLPNLVELQLQSLAKADEAEQHIADLMAMLTSARSLKVVVLEVSGAGDQLKSMILCRDKEFPPALEYLCWRPNFVLSQHFRFVTGHPEGGIVKTEAGGKRGCLQRVPPVFPSRITRDGSWPRYFLESWAASVLGHIGVPIFQIE